MKTIKIILLVLCMSTLHSGEAKAGIPIAKIIKEGVKKVIKAVDLMVQRLQNKTIWLQNAQKVLENKLSELKLTEIAEWTGKHRTLYKEYYEELWKVRNAIASYYRVRQLLERQVRLVDEYKRVWDTLSKDDHFTRQELEYMYRVYSGILKESLRNLDQVALVVNSFKTQMSDAKRLEILSACQEEIEKNYADLKMFNSANIRLSISRARDEHEVNGLKKIYGL